MAFIIKDRVKETTTTTGTGAVSLGGSTATFDTFQSYMSNGDTTYYAIVHTTSGTDEWEVGLGTWNTGNTLTRTTVLSGSNGTSAVNFSAGNKDVFMTYPASVAATLDNDSNDLSASVTLGNHDTDDLAEGSTNQYYADSLVDAHLSGGTGVTYSSGAISIGQSVGTSDNVTFNSVTVSGDPTSALQVASKEYVDTIASAGIHYHDPVRVETPSALTASYNNGSSGVGATLTNSGTQAALVIDGITMAVNDRVLVYNQTNQAHNGIYTVTNVGSSSTNWVMTRATDADSYGASDPDSFGKGDAFFVKEGNTGAGELYVMTTAGTITFGTTAIHFSQVAETAVYNAGNSLTLTGTTFDTVQDIRTTASPTFSTVNANLTGNVTGNVTGSSGSTTGNAATATALATSRTISLTGDVSGSASFDGTANASITATVANDSHTHDGRYYTETEADSRFVNVTGDTMTGSMRLDQESLSASGGTLNINLANANNFKITISANTTFSFSNKDAGRGGNLIIVQNATGGYSFTLPAECKTPVNGASIVQSTGANEVSILSYYVVDSSNILVNYIGDFA